MVITDRPGTFTVLFLLNAVTFGVYTLFVLRVPVPRAIRPAAARSRDYRDVLADRVFVRLAVLNLLVVVGAVSLLNSLFPVYAKNQATVSEHVIGAYFLLNSLVIIVLQMPIVRATEGRRRMQAFALMGVLFALSWLQIAVGGSCLGHPEVVLLLGMGIFTLSLAECLYDAVVGPLVSDLAPPDLLGRYMSVMGFSWQLGFIIGPAVGAFLLGLEPVAVWPVMSLVCVMAGGYALVLERRLPTDARRNPHRVAAAPTDLAPEPAP
ncbi:MAG: MFS transporter [Sporichthyaceae bacterium]|nr:MFS transporter [Sporichthyaceae bacterium]